ncbi:MAG: hypothetical protein K0R09_2126 [Clostridiales bacterium]|jgi:uncharacterized membrane protein YjjB (DUF3815 family)|nr:hypothetical protein [Clostridiales bacterium]
MIKQIILAFFGSVFLVVLFNIDRKKLLWAGLCGSLGWIVYLLVFEYTSSATMSSFAGSFVVGLYSEFMAKRFKTPASEFSIPGIFPLVPGLTAFNAVKYLVEKNNAEALAAVMQTISVGGAIGFGIMLSTTTVRFMLKIFSSNKLSD